MAGTRRKPVDLEKIAGIAGVGGFADIDPGAQDISSVQCRALNTARLVSRETGRSFRSARILCEGREVVRIFRTA